MGQIIYLTPVSSMPQSIVQLSLSCRSQLLAMLFVRIVGEDLRPDAAGLTFTSKHPDWLALPAPKITTINSLGVETLKFETTHYTYSQQGGTVTFLTPTTDTVRADYSYFPFSEQQIANFGLAALKEISVLIYRPIPTDLIHGDYAVAICKRLFTNVLKTLLVETREYFSVSVGGRSVNKTNITAQINSIIEQNEVQLQHEINILRTFNKTNRMLPSFTCGRSVLSNALIN